ncbi:MAG: UDP-N-acetylglucosamine 1-carboxyvinyltransferase [Thermodesulfobacteriota bacterium]
MDKLLIKGGYPLNGEISISGSKNGALPILLASMLVPEEITLSGIPDLKDIQTTLHLLQLFGCRASRSGDRVSIKAGDSLAPEAPYDLVRTMRASVLCLGPLLSRLGEAKVAMPGGCAIGNRPVDMHLRGLEKMGANIDLESGYIHASCNRLKGAHITLDFPTVGGTENLLMAAVLAKGETTLENAAREPEIQDLANFLNQCGARISGHGTGSIKITGVDHLRASDYTIMPDRIEAGTYIAAAALTKGDLLIKRSPVAYMENILDKLLSMGVDIETIGSDQIRVKQSSPLRCIDVTTQPYPGFPTDMQAQVMTLMCVSSGAGMIQETIFENRFMHALELMRLGANITLSGDTAFIRGVDKLVGAPVMASDLRASASLVLAGLIAERETEVRRIYHLDRGYERMEEKLSHVGANISRTREE